MNSCKYYTYANVWLDNHKSIDYNVKLYIVYVWYNSVFQK